LQKRKNMIQRIQSVYLFVAILCLGFVTFGSTLFSFITKKAELQISSFGVKQIKVIGGQTDYTVSIPAYIIGIGLMLIGIATLFSFKKLPRQHKFGRMFFYTYFAVLLSVILFFYFGSSRVANGITAKQLDLGFFLLVIGFPFTFLANTGINRDKKLLDSLNRLR
jgi:phosphoglycerol transferase MdoB-like AlkP superfamily enzyme